MDNLDELTMASLYFAAVDRRYEEALKAFTEEVDAKKSDLRLSLACKLAEEADAWEKAEKRLKRAAKRVRRYF
jgi:hypothetical protein